MEQDPLIPPTRDLPTSLLQLLSNTIVLYQTTPYLPVSSQLALGATSKSFKELIYTTPKLFRHLDLSEIKSAQSVIGSIDHGGEVWRNVQLDENVTENDFYGGPLRGIFCNIRKRNILQDVQTLILDGLAVPADLVTEIITHESFNVRILSIRDVQHLNERRLQQALLYTIRPSRPADTPKLKGLYMFGPKDTSSRTRLQNKQHIGPCGRGAVNSRGAQIGAQWNAKSEDALAEDIAKNSDNWFGRSGKLFPRLISPEWAEILQACRGIISFDAVLCAGPRHSDMKTVLDTTYPHYHIPPRVATHALDGCNGCGRAPEGLSKLGHSNIDGFPLLAPPTLHSSTTKAAKTPPRSLGYEKKLLVRCIDCLRSRYCESCHKWWCEDCYEVNNNGYISNQSWELESESAQLDKNVKPGVIRSCFECGFNCAPCVEKTQKMCKVCGGGYCLIHNEGSTLTTCDWCARSGRRTRELY